LGDRAAAVRAFEDCRSVLRKELNLEPGLETQRLAVLVARGVRLPSVTHVRVEPPERLPDANREVTTLLEAARVLDSLGRTETAFETLLAACAVLSEIEATDVLEQLVRQLEVRAGSDELIARASQARAWLHFQRGEFVAAEQSARRGLSLTTDAGLRSHLENELAAALLRQGRVTEALEWQRRAVETLPGGSLEYAVALSELALSLANADEYPAAEGAYLEADALLEHFGATRHRITLLHNLSMTLKHQGRAAAALEPLEIASRLMQGIPGLVDDERYGHANRAEVLLQLDRCQEALECLSLAERLSLAHNLPYSFVHYRRAQVHLILGDASAAERDLERATRSAGVHPRGQGFALLLKARVAALRGQDWQTALRTAEAALTGTGSRAYLARAHLLRALWSEPETGFAIASCTVLAARELGMGGLEISALSVLVRQGRLLGRAVEIELTRAAALLETLEPLDLTRAEVLRFLQGQPHPPRAEDAVSGISD
jgi:tetratricopeptide (TPR) repeat protein